MKKVFSALLLVPISAFAQYEDNSTRWDDSTASMLFWIFLVLVFIAFLVGYIWCIYFICQEAGRRKINKNNVLALSIFVTPIAGLLYLLLRKGETDKNKSDYENG